MTAWIPDLSKLFIQDIFRKGPVPFYCTGPLTLDLQQPEESECLSQ